MFYSFVQEVANLVARLLLKLPFFLVGVFVLVLLVSCDLDNTIDDQSNLLHKFDSRWSIVNIWAVWCAPCLEEIPELNKLHQEGVVRVFGIDYDDSSGEALRKKILELNIQFPIQSKAILTPFNIGVPQVLPITYLFSPQGKWVGSMLGNQTLKSIKERINEIVQNDEVAGAYDRF